MAGGAFRIVKSVDGDQRTGHSSQAKDFSVCLWHSVDLGIPPECAQDPKLFQTKCLQDSFLLFILTFFPGPSDQFWGNPHYVRSMVSTDPSNENTFFCEITRFKFIYSFYNLCK